MTREDWYEALSKVVSRSDGVDIASVLDDVAAFVAAESEALTDAQIRQRIKGLRALLLSRQQARAAAKYLKAKQKEAHP